MFFHALKAHFCKETNADQSPTSIPLKIPIDFAKFVQKVQEVASQVFINKEGFLQNYLFKMFSTDNQCLKLDFRYFQSSLSIKQFKDMEIRSYLLEWLHQEKSPILTILDIWTPYIHQEITQTENVQTFLSHEIRNFVRFMMAVLKEFIPHLHKQKLALEFQFKLLNLISKSTQFKQIMKVYLARFNKKKGSSGQFTEQQIFESVRELDDLINFAHIPQPFNKSIQHMILFYDEHRLKKKIQWVVETINQAREEINQYREEHDMGSTVIGSDQMFPVVNYICEKTNKNILAAVSYINAFFGTDIVHRDKMLSEIGPEAGYCLQLVESVSGVYCHASQFLPFL